MSGVKIREYRDGDFSTVREVFSLGMSEHVPASFVHFLKQPQCQMLLMSIFCALLASSKSFLLPVLAITLLLAIVRQLVVYNFNNYIEQCCSTDLNSISETYMAARDACFWVAENEGRVVGMVACLPKDGVPDCLELKRLSVLCSHRGRGVAKKLCQVVTDFTRERGYAGVVLHTSVVQTDARKLYAAMGFRKLREFPEGNLAAKLINFSLFEYRLDLHKDHAADVTMSGVKIREYRDGDFSTLREIFSLGTSERVSASFVQFLKQPQCQILFSSIRSQM